MFPISTISSPPSSPFLHFPWPFLDDLDQELLVSQRSDMVITEEKKNKSKKKKDRHSKICTAQGMRDRRMRLSVEVARSFFDLQDMLGFDKASKTIAWLLNNCEAQIKKLVSLSEESEVDSEDKGVEMKQTGEEEEARKKRRRREACNEEAAMIHLSRESRNKARARARERTREKLRESISNPHISQLHVSGDQDSGVVEEIMGVRRSSSCSTFSYNSPDFAAKQKNEFLGMEEATLIEAAPGCYTMRSKKPSIAQNNPNAMLRTTHKPQQHQHWNPFQTSSNSTGFFHPI